MLYILIPGLFLGGGLYLEWWSTPLPAWVEWIPYQSAAALLLFMFFGSVLLFVEEGDMLFLRQTPGWMKGLMIRGIGYSIGVTTLKALLFLFIVLPFLLRAFQLDAWTLTAWALLAAGTASCANLVVHRIRVRFVGIKKWLYSMFMRWLSVSFYLMIITALKGLPAAVAAAGVLLMAVTVLLVRFRLSMKGSFTADVREDARIRMRLTDKVLVQAVGRPPRVRSKVWLFRKSGRIYRSSAPDKRFAEAGVKAFLRSPESLLLYVQFSAVGIPAVFFPPFIIKLIVFAALMLLLSYLLNTKWIAFAESDFSLVLPFSGAQQQSAGTLAVRTLMIIPAFILSLTFGLSLWPDWTGIGVGVILAFISSVSIPVLFSQLSWKRKL